MELHRYRPELEKGNAVQFVKDRATPYLTGTGLDIGCSKWKVKEEAVGVDIREGPNVDLVVTDWSTMPSDKYDYVFSSHCLEHILHWKTVLNHWVRVIKPGGIIFLYLPNPVMYNRWSKEHLKAHKHDFTLPIIAKEFIALNLKIGEQGYDEYAGMWIIGKKK